MVSGCFPCGTDNAVLADVRGWQSGAPRTTLRSGEELHNSSLPCSTLGFGSGPLPVIPSPAVCRIRILPPRLPRGATVYKWLKPQPPLCFLLHSNSNSCSIMTFCFLYQVMHLCSSYFKKKLLVSYIKSFSNNVFPRPTQPSLEINKNTYVAFY